MNKGLASLIKHYKDDYAGEITSREERNDVNDDDYKKLLSYYDKTFKALSSRNDSKMLDALLDCYFNWINLDYVEEGSDDYFSPYLLDAFKSKSREVFNNLLIDARKSKEIGSLRIKYEGLIDELWSPVFELTQFSGEVTGWINEIVSESNADDINKSSIGSPLTLGEASNEMIYYLYQILKVKFDD